jgi:hypothetical protein
MLSLNMLPCSVAQWKNLFSQIKEVVHVFFGVITGTNLTAASLLRWLIVITIVCHKGSLALR